MRLPGPRCPVPEDQASRVFVVEATSNDRREHRRDPRGVVPGDLRPRRRCDHSRETPRPLIVRPETDLDFLPFLAARDRIALLQPPLGCGERIDSPGGTTDVSTTALERNVDETFIADLGAEVENCRPLRAIAERREREVEQSLERHPFGRPGHGAQVFEIPLHDEVREAGEREVVEVDLPRRGELTTRRLIVKRFGHRCSFPAASGDMAPAEAGGGKVETVGVEPTSASLQARCSVRLSYIPSESVRTGGVEPPQRGATGLQPAELADAQRPRTESEGWPAGLEPAPTGITAPGASVYTTTTMERGRPGS